MLFQFSLFSFLSLFFFGLVGLVIEVLEGNPDDSSEVPLVIFLC